MCRNRLQIILLPGLDGTGLLFKPFLATQPERFASSVITYPATQVLTYGELESLVRPQLPADEPFLLVAESYSGPLALKLAHLNPANLLGVVLVASFAKAPVPLWMGMLAHVSPYSLLERLPLKSGLATRLLLGKDAPLSLKQLLNQALQNVPLPILSSRIHAVVTTDETTALLAIKKPILYLHATNDWLVRLPCMKWIQRWQPTLAIEHIPGPHLILQCNPHDSWKAITAFVDTISPNVPGDP